MPRRVYLGHLDIGLKGELDLRTQHGAPTVDDVTRYLFIFGLIADEVFMQGSAPLKSDAVFGAFRRLKEAFTRNERFESKPVFAFVLSDECESYTDYLCQRLDFLSSEGSNNPELGAYDRNSAEVVVTKLDSQLSLADVPKRINSVSKNFRKSLLAKLGAGDTPGIDDETANIALRRIHDRDTIQTFSLIDRLELDDAKQLNNIYQLVRDTYRQANAFGSLAKDSDEFPHYSPANIICFLNAIGLEVFVGAPSAITTEAMFKLRLNAHLGLLVSEYYHCQSERDLKEMFGLLTQFRVNGKFRSILKESPGAAVAMIFQMLNEANIGIRAINKGVEQLAKRAIGEAFDEKFTQKYLKMFSAIDALRKDLNRIIRNSCP